MTKRINILRAYSTSERAAKAAREFAEFNGGTLNDRHNTVDFLGHNLRVYFRGFEDEDSVMQIAGAEFSFAILDDQIDRGDALFIQRRIRRVPLKPL